MTVLTITHDYKASVAAHRMYKASVTHAHTTIPKVMPQSAGSSRHGAGKSWETRFTHGTHLESLKHKVHSHDDRKLKYKYGMIEGEKKHETIKSVSYEVQYEDNGRGRCTVKLIMTYDIKDRAELKKTYIETEKQFFNELCKAVEKHLLENPAIHA